MVRVTLKLKLIKLNPCLKQFFLNTHQSFSIKFLLLCENNSFFRFFLVYVYEANVQQCYQCQVYVLVNLQGGALQI